MTQKSWQIIRSDLHVKHPPSYFIRSKMKAKLGFTVREHSAWIPKMDGGYSELQIHLDFYDERKKTLFLLSYGDKIETQRYED